MIKRVSVIARMFIESEVDDRVPLSAPYVIIIITEDEKEYVHPTMFTEDSVEPFMDSIRVKGYVDTKHWNAMH